MPGVSQGSSGRVAGRVMCECDCCVFDEYVQYVYVYVCSSGCLLLCEVVLVLLAGHRPCSPAGCENCV